MRSGASSGVTSESDGVAGFYHLVDGYELLGHVGVVGLESVAMTDDDVFSVACCLVAHYAYFAAEGCADGVADVDFDVESFVLTSPAWSVVAGDDAACCGHVVAAEVDLIGFGDG